MKAKEELIKLVLDNDFLTAPRLRAEFRSLLDRVEIEAQAEFKNCNIPHVSGSYIAFCDGADEGVEGLVQLSNSFDNEQDGKRYCESFKSKSPVLYKLVE